MKKLLAFIFLLLSVSPALATPPLGNPIVSVQSAAEEGNHVLKATPGWLNGFDATTDTTAGYVLFFDATSDPSDGSVMPKLCFVLPATQTTGASWLTYPVPFDNGIIIVFSTTGCFTKTESATAFFSAQVQ